MEEVRALQDAGQFAESIGVLRDLLDQAPDGAEANYRLGLALAKTGEPIRAAWPLQRAVTDPEYTVSAGLLLATLYHQTKNYDEAARAADTVLEVESDHLDALRVRANAHLAARRLDLALEDALHLVDLAPDDYHAQALLASALADGGQLDEARLAHDRLKVLGAESEDALVVQRSCIAPAIFAADSLHDQALARKHFEDCAARAPTDPIVLETLARFYDAASEPARANEIIEAAATAKPDDLGLRLLHFRRVFSQGETEDALAMLLATSEHFDSAASWSALASVYRSIDRHEEAFRAIEKTIELSPVPDPLLLFTRADILIDLGELERAGEAADRLEHETYAHLIRGRILLLSGEPAAALAEFEQGIRAWPNNPGARFLAGLAARDLGDHDRALSELREAVRAGRGETEAALELARIHYQRGDYDQAIAFSNTALSGSRGKQQAGPYVIIARALVRQGEHDRALRPIAALEQRGFVLDAVRERALLERNRGRPDAAVDAILASPLDPSDPAHFELLGQLVEALSELGQLEVAMARTDTALARSPESGPLHQIRGVALLRSGRGADAEAAFQRAVELDGESAISLVGLATLRHGAGDLHAAIQLFDRADALDPGDASHAYAAAQLVLTGGDRVEAERRLRAIVKRSPAHVGAANDLAWILAEEGRDLDLALELVEAARVRSRTPEVLDTAGWVRLRRGEFQQAIDALEEAVAARPNSASMRYRHALALEGAGELARARQALETALALGAFPEAAAARAALSRLGPTPSS
jgi:tetratricopeptide (TPR) repeat protein